MTEAVCRRDALRKTDAEIAAMEKEREMQIYQSAQVCPVLYLTRLTLQAHLKYCLK